jgi:tetratricopeptide (TPR) repeat protein
MSKRRAERRARAPQAAAPIPPATTASLPWWHVAILLIAGAAIYSNSLSGPFVFDDSVSVVTNTSIREWNSGVLFASREVPTAGRPLVNVSMALNYALGGLDVRGYHLWNIAMHLSCTLLLFACARLTLRSPRVPGWLRVRASEVACAIALVWAVHPLNSEVVDYVTERSESMMALAFLATIYASARALSSTRRNAWQALAVTACALGMACKESMVTAPVAILLYDTTLVFESFLPAIRARWRFYGALASTWLILAALLQTGARVHSAGFSIDVTPWTYLLNQAVMIVRYLRLSVWPSSLVVNYGWPRPLTLADVFPSALFIVALMAVTLFALRQWPALGFLGGWFFMTLAPASSILPIATEVGAERRMYLPLIALVGLGMVGLAWLSRRLPHGRAIAIAAVAVLTAALGATTLARNREYASPLGLAETVLARWPTPSAEAAVGQELAIVGRHDEGIARLREAAPRFPRAYYHLGGELFNQGKMDEAVPALQNFVRFEPQLAEAVPARTMMGRAFMLQQRWAEAEEQLRLVLSMAPPRSAAHTTALGFLADTLFAEQKFAEARGAYVTYLGERPTDAGATTNLAVSLSALGRLDEAVSAFRRAVEMNPGDAQARRNLAIALEDQAQAAKRR